MVALLSALCERSDYKLVRLNSCSYNGQIVQLQSALNDDYNNFSGKTKHVPHFRAYNWKIFPKPCACTFTSEQFHWFIQLRKEMLQHFARFWHPLPSVMWSRSILVPFYLGVSLSLSWFYSNSVGGTSAFFGQFSYLCPKKPEGSEEAPIYIVQSERTTNSRRKMKRNVFKF